MRENRRSIVKNKKGFTGLEAAIVLTAFIVVAAVFSYMVLGAGFFSTEKAKAVVHTGVEQATSSAELVGDVIGHSADPQTNITQINFTVQLTAGQNPIDLDKSSIALTTKDYHNESLYWIHWNPSGVGDNDNMLEAGEKAVIAVTIVEDIIEAYTEFQLEFKPEIGGTLLISKSGPGGMYSVNVLH